VCEKVRFKEFRLVKQGLRELEVEEAKADLYLLVRETTLSSLVGAPLRSPLGDLFFCDFFLLMLSNPFSSNTPIPFL